LLALEAVVVHDDDGLQSQQALNSRQYLMRRIRRRTDDERRSEPFPLLGDTDESLALSVR